MATVETLVDAATDGDLDEVRRLVEVEGVDPSARNVFGTMALHRACMRGQTRVARYLMEEARVDVEGAVSSDGLPSLFGAAIMGHLDVVRVLVEVGGADVDQPCGDKGCTALHGACLFGKLDIIKYLVEHGHADITAKTLCGKTPFDFSVMKFPNNSYHSFYFDGARYLLTRMAFVDDAETLENVWI